MGRLYFTMDDNECNRYQLLATGTQLDGRVTMLDAAESWPTNWPVPDYCIALTLQRPGVPTDHGSFFYFMCERASVGWRNLRFVDQINPAFRRLQRWFRRTARRALDARRLAFMLATHARLGGSSPAGGVNADAMSLIVRRI
jgi:hypothetical protein